MADQTAQQNSELLTGKIGDLDKYVCETYAKRIDYYWKASRLNKKNFKRYRYWTTILGALVTLIASLTTSSFITSSLILETLFTVATPILAATLTIISGISQNFQWGATWRDMVVNAQRLEKERDRFLATDAANRNYLQELQIINETVIDETQSFFQRVLDSEVIPSRTREMKDKNP